MQISAVSRGAGRRATAAAAYRAGERLRDERSAQLHDFRRRRDVLHSEIFLPQQLESLPLEWARNRERLWNTAEHAEKRHNARVAREIEVNLPAELSPLQRLGLARAFAREVAERYRVAVDLAVHAPRPEGDPRNFHAHLLATTREVTPAGLGAKTGLDLTAGERRRRELPDHRAEFLYLRERWASLANEALREANIDARIDHRSLLAQGVQREPRPRIPIMHLKMEQRGVRSEVAARVRADYGRRAAAAAREAPRAEPQQPAVSQDLETVRAQAREAWLRLRNAARTAAEPVASAEPAHGADEDFSR